MTAPTPAPPIRRIRRIFCVSADDQSALGRTASFSSPPSAGSVIGYTATFAGNAPADDPQLVVVVSIQNPKQGRYGGQLGGPVFSDIMDFALPRLGIAPSGTPAPTVPVFAE